MRVRVRVGGVVRVPFMELGCGKALTLRLTASVYSPNEASVKHEILRAKMGNLRFSAVDSYIRTRGHLVCTSGDMDADTGGKVLLFTSFDNCRST